MAHFAEIDPTTMLVTFVARGRDEDDETELSARTGRMIRRTSYNTYGGQHLLGGTPFRKNYAGIGFTYDPDRDAFIPPASYPSWVLNEDTCLWEPPTPKPEGDNWMWDEATVSWIESTAETDAPPQP